MAIAELRPEKFEGFARGGSSVTKSKAKTPSRNVSGHPKTKGQTSGHETGMKREDLLARIIIDPNVCHGKPCIRGHRIWVSLILDFLAGGMTPKEILDDYPGIEEADIRACIAYGAEMARGHFVDVVLGENE
jgi:uncharacterized protein (DUF433 family)